MSGTRMTQMLLMTTDYNISVDPQHRTVLNSGGRCLSIDQGRAQIVLPWAIGGQRVGKRRADGPG